MLDRPTLAPTARRILELARSDRAAAAAALAELEVEAQAQLVCETPLGRRAALLGLIERPEEVVPLLPEAELCFTIKAGGVSDGAWLIELASEEQLRACFDLDVWRGSDPDPRSLDEWMGALAQTAGAAQLRALRALDPELLVLFLRQRIEVELKPPDDESWQPSEGLQTLEGQFYFGPRRSDDDIAPVVTLLHGLFEGDYWTYFRMLQGVLWELPTENEEWALRWRLGRLADLGFPTWESAMRIYGYLPPARWAEVPEDEKPFGTQAWSLPVWVPPLPATADSRHSVFRAIAALDDAERRAAFYALVALANRVAVADRLPLGDADSIPEAIEKAARTASLGLDHVAERSGLAPVEVLRRLPLERLFRVGANLDPEGARPPLREP